LAPDLVRLTSTAAQAEWKVAGAGTVPDTLLGPEGSGVMPHLRPFTAMDPHRDEPPSMLGRRRLR
jgi:hypothetical protein